MKQITLSVRASGLIGIRDHGRCLVFVWFSSHGVTPLIVFEHQPMKGTKKPIFIGLNQRIRT